MPLTAHLHGSPGRLPFIGHFRAAARSGPVAFSVAGAVAVRSEPQIAFDAAVYHCWGWKPLFYFVFCIFLAGGLHPCAGHFISEHYVFPHLDATQETYSYYGPLNWLTWNVG